MKFLSIWNQIPTANILVGILIIVLPVLLPAES